MLKQEHVHYNAYENSNAEKSEAESTSGYFTQLNDLDARTIRALSDIHSSLDVMSSLLFCEELPKRRDTPAIDKGAVLASTLNALECNAMYAEDLAEAIKLMVNKL